MALGVFRHGEVESGVRFPRNPIGRPGTNGNRTSWEIPLNSVLKEQLISHIHSSYRTRPRQSRYGDNED